MTTERTPRTYRKVAPITAIQATEGGTIETPEGVMSYSAGDYLATDVPPTHTWPIKRAIFEATYIEDEAAEAEMREVARLRSALKAVEFRGAGVVKGKIVLTGCCPMCEEYLGHAADCIILLSTTTDSPSESGE